MPGSGGTIGRGPVGPLGDVTGVCGFAGGVTAAWADGAPVPPGETPLPSLFGGSCAPRAPADVLGVPRDDGASPCATSSADALWFHQMAATTATTTSVARIAATASAFSFMPDAGRAPGDAAVRCAM